jgi:hypothetical protein
VVWRQVGAVVWRQCWEHASQSSNPLHGSLVWILNRFLPIYGIFCGVSCVATRVVSWSQSKYFRNIPKRHYLKRIEIDLYPYRDVSVWISHVSLTEIRSQMCWGTPIHQLEYLTRSVHESHTNPLSDTECGMNLPNLCNVASCTKLGHVIFSFVLFFCFFFLKYKHAC